MSANDGGPKKPDPLGIENRAAPPAPGNDNAALTTRQPQKSHATQLPNIAAPALSLPKGGGAIQGIGEKLSANPATGAGSLQIPVYTSPGRLGMQPALQVAYSSGAGNGPFGLGFSLSIPAVSVRTEKRLPEYRDADVFVLSGVEDLVPSTFHGIWNNGTRMQGTYTVTCYQPRVDTQFARIERWKDSVSGDCYWRSITRDSLVNVYGQSPGARIADPDKPQRIFRWLLESTTDSKGNVVYYRYRSEDGVGIAPAIYEQRRRATNVYPDRILYGNRASALTGTPRPDHPEDWLFEVVFDYGERALQVLPTLPTYVPPTTWSARLDPFSHYKAGFEIRTRRLCRRILMFHRIDDTNTPVLVRSTDFQYGESPDITFLAGATQTGYDSTQAPAYLQLPALALTYTQAVPDTVAHPLDTTSLRNLPYGLDESKYKWVDLNDEGVAGALTQQAGGWFYKRNEGGGKLGGPELVMQLPARADLGVQRLVDLEQDGKKYLVQWDGALPGAQARLADGTWGPFVAFTSRQTQDVGDPNARLIDLDGDGRADLLVSEDTVLRWYPSLGIEGFGPSASVAKPWDEDQGPALVFANAEQAIYLADMSGDGLSDIVRIRNGDICYWPNLGYGRFGPKVTMGSAPLFDGAELFDQRRIVLADVDGSGTTDIFYLAGSGARYWLNCAGNRFDGGHDLVGFPGFDSVTHVEAIDLLGNGTSCLVWSTPSPSKSGQPMRYLALTGGIKPHLLQSSDNGRGLSSRLTWGASTEFYLGDRRAGAPWATRLPFPVQVVKQIDVADSVTGDELTTRYAFHHGFYDGVEKEFRGFGMVEQWDTEVVDPNQATGATRGVTADVLAAAPIHTKTWFHTGAFLEQKTLEEVFATEYYQLPGVFVLGMPEHQLESISTAIDARQAIRALAGQVLRREVYADDGAVDDQGNSLVAIPFEVSANNYHVKALQPASDTLDGIFITRASESVTCQLERNPADPRVRHEVTLAGDDFGNVTDIVSLGYPRRAANLEGVAGQDQVLAIYTRNDVTNVADQNDWYRIGVTKESRSWEVEGFANAPVPPAPLTVAAPTFSFAVVAQVLGSAEIAFEAAFDPSLLQCKLIADGQVYYRDNDGQTELPLGTVVAGGLPSRTRRMVFSQALLDGIFDTTHALPTGLLTGNGYQLDGDEYWASSSAATYDPGIFYQSRSILDPYGNPTTIGYDPDALFVTSVTDVLANVTSVVIDTRVLQPRALIDANGNQSLVTFDPLGRIVAAALQGKAPAANQPPVEGDTLASPTSSVEYHLETIPTLIIRRARETHQYPDHIGAIPDWRTVYAYYDGFGREVMTKVEDDDAQPSTQVSTKWVGSGRTIYNVKGEPVKQYEPYFSNTPAFESEQSVVQSGETSIIRYDALGRVIRLDRPNGTFSLVEFEVWTRRNYDENDTLGSHGPNAWYTRFGISPPTTPQQTAAINAFEHRDTPTIFRFDVLGRVVVTGFTNVEYPSVVRTPVEYPRINTLDIDGNTLATVASNRSSDGTVVSLGVLTRKLDMLGRALYSASADSGGSWTALDVSDRPICSYEARGYRVLWTYDTLRRVTQRRVRAPGATTDTVAEQYLYGEGLLNLTDENGAPATPQALNLLGRRYQQKDRAGILTSIRYDFKGSLVFGSRQLTTDYSSSVIDWSTTPVLDPTIYVTGATFDAMGREVTTEQPDGDRASHIAGTVTRKTYGKHLLLRTVSATQTGSTAVQSLVTEIDYNEKGQRNLIRYGSGATTTYTYESDTFRLSTLTTTDSGGNALQGLTFYYDPVGNIARIDDSATATVTYNSGSVSSSQTFVYDALYRVTQATGREQIGQTSVQDQTYGYNLPAPTDLKAMRNYTESYVYDRLGNFQTFQHAASVGGGFVNNWTRRYETDVATSNQLSSTSLNGSETGPHYSLPYAYDAAGNAIRLPHLGGAPGTPNCAWDDKDQLIGTVLDVTADPTDSTDRAYYQYDASGQRVRKVVLSGSNVKRERIYVGAYERFIHTSGSTVTERRSVHVMDDRRRVAILETKVGGASVLRFQHDNQIGSSIFELDGSGRMISREEYHPYGTTSLYIAPSAALDVDIKRYRYNGKERDDETGLYYVGARYLAPWLGRWLSCDPIGTGDGPNLYAYAQDNPVRFNDPNGHQAAEGAQASYEAQKNAIVFKYEVQKLAIDLHYAVESALLNANYRVQRFVQEVTFAAQMAALEVKFKQELADLTFKPNLAKEQQAEEANKKLIAEGEKAAAYRNPPPEKWTLGLDAQTGGSGSNLGPHGGSYLTHDYFGLNVVWRNLALRPPGGIYRAGDGQKVEVSFLREPAIGILFSNHYNDPGDLSAGALHNQAVDHLTLSGQFDIFNISKGRLEFALTAQAGYDFTGKSAQLVGQAGLKVTLLDPSPDERGANRAEKIWSKIPVLSKFTLRAFVTGGVEEDYDPSSHDFSFKRGQVTFGLVGESNPLKKD